MTSDAEAAAASPKADEAGELAERLSPMLARATDWEEPRVEGLARLSGGASRDTWRFDANASGEPLERYLAPGDAAATIADAINRELGTRST